MTTIRTDVSKQTVTFKGSLEAGFRFDELDALIEAIRYVQRTAPKPASPEQLHARQLLQLAAPT